MAWELYRGDCLEMMAAMEPCSVDALICDPPYGLGKPPPIEDVLRAWLGGERYQVSGGGFMGRKWDAFVPGPHFWRLAFAAMKPGAHGVVFAGQRTVDVMGIALRLAGFQVRDLVGWQYWSGFPKSHDVSKAIDRTDGVRMTREAQLRCTAWMRSTGITASQINEATGTFMASHYLTAKSQPAIPTLEHLEAIRHLLPPVPQWLEQYAHIRSIESENMKRRKVVASRVGVDTTQSRIGMPLRPNALHTFEITTSHTPDAARFEGYGTALKPCIEPALLVRKPLEGTVAANVLRWGTGGLNVDGCRYPFGDPAWPGPKDDPGTRNNEASRDGSPTVHLPPKVLHSSPFGRWPANVYMCPKASTAERERGCDGLPTWSAGEMVDRTEGSAGMANPRAGAGRTSTGRRNRHPTVKPVKLLRWLSRLCMGPDGGTVLDPFAGSGSCGVAAVLEGFDYVGAELEADYQPIAMARIGHAVERPDLWIDTRPGPPVDEATAEEAEATVAGQIGMFGGGE